MKLAIYSLLFALLGSLPAHATVWVNGNLVNRNWSGYNELRIDITPYLLYGDKTPNVIAVRVDANAMEGWWYEGAGMYRARVDVEIIVTAPDGRQVARRSTAIDVPVLTQVTASLPLTIHDPALWSPDSVKLYQVTTTVRRDGKTVDQIALDTGFRTLRFDGARGFFLNGEHVKLQGVCLHQDHAGVGVAIPDAIWAYRQRRLKELGVNAIRFPHNAIAPEVMDMADRMGFLVMAENRNFNPSPDYMQQFEWLLKRDRHHPKPAMLLARAVSQDSSAASSKSPALKANVL